MNEIRLFLIENLIKLRRRLRVADAIKLAKIDVARGLAKPPDL